jgi:hypothetical protein
MRIDEFAHPINDNLPFDVVDDVSIYMRNDPMFYRKSFFPAIMKMKDIHDAGKTPNPEVCLGEVCNRAMESYCKKFNLGRKENIFKDDDRNLLIKKLFGEEMKQIKDGAY